MQVKTKIIQSIVAVRISLKNTKNGVFLDKDLKLIIKLK